MAYWERLHEVLNREVVAERDRFFMAMLKRVGIEKARPWKAASVCRPLFAGRVR